MMYVRVKPAATATTVGRQDSKHRRTILRRRQVSPCAIHTHTHLRRTYTQGFKFIKSRDLPPLVYRHAMHKPNIININIKLASPHKQNRLLCVFTLSVALLCESELCIQWLCVYDASYVRAYRKKQNTLSQHQTKSRRSRYHRRRIIRMWIWGFVSWSSNVRRLESWVCVTSYILN